LSVPAAAEEKVRQLLVDLRLLEGSARVIQARLEVVVDAINDVGVAHTTLDGMKAVTQGSEVLVPVGGGSFVRASLTDVEKIIMGVGAGVAVEKPIDESITELKSRLDELERARNALQEQLTQTAVRIEETRGTLSELVRQGGGQQ
jgi:prefoldin alpha subunit